LTPHRKDYALRMCCKQENSRFGASPTDFALLRPFPVF
jgi:hypothetical protein